MNEFIKRTKIYSIDDLKRDCKYKTKGYWFDDETLRFFNSRISNDLFYSPKNESIYFVSSEKFDYKSDRKYSIRKYDFNTGEIDTVGEFQQYNSGQVAKNNITKIIRGI